MTKATFKHVLPPLSPKGRTPLEYALLARAAKMAAQIEREGEPDDLFTRRQFAHAIGSDHDWLGKLMKTGRGPEPTYVGQRSVFRRRHIVAWLQFLARKHEALEAA